MSTYARFLILGLVLLASSSSSRITGLPTCPNMLKVGDGGAESSAGRNNGSWASSDAARTIGISGVIDSRLGFIRSDGGGAGAGDELVVTPAAVAFEDVDVGGRIRFIGELIETSSNLRGRGGLDEREAFVGDVPAPSGTTIVGKPLDLSEAVCLFAGDGGKTERARKGVYSRDRWVLVKTGGVIVPLVFERI